MRAQGIFLNYIEEWARLLFLLQILGFSLSFFTKIALFMFAEFNLQMQQNSD